MGSEDECGKWGSKTTFLDLPLMDEETFKNFVETIGKFSELF